MPVDDDDDVDVVVRRQRRFNYLKKELKLLKENDVKMHFVVVV